MKENLAPRQGLEKMKNLMAKLGNPQDQIPTIHVAGTNGKGSVCAMLNQILIESGYRVALFTSPHMMSYCERIQIQNTPIAIESFNKLKITIEDNFKEMVGNKEEMPTFFEYITAMAFLYFAQEEVDLAIIETGIGGRYDPSNVIKKPLVSVITSIGKDHTKMLGNTISQITREKAGIIKENSYTVLYDSPLSVYNKVKDICRAKNNHLLTCKDIEISQVSYQLTHTTFKAKHQAFTYNNIYLRLLGDHQIANAKTVLMTLESLKSQGYHIPQEALYKGLKNTQWPGRMEIIQEKPMIILDGAHNPESAKAFAKALATIIKQTKKGKVYLLVGVLKDKDYQGMMKILAPLAHQMIVTQVEGHRGLPAQELYEAAQAICHHPPLILQEDKKQAYETARGLLEDQDILCCLGSLYLVAEIKKLVQEEKSC